MCHIGSIHTALDHHCTTLDLKLHCKSSFQSHQLFTTAPAPLEVVLYTEAQVRNAIEWLKSAPAYVEVLRLEQAPIPAKKGRKHQTPPPSEPVLSEQEIAGQSLLDTSVVPADNREGPDPGTFEELRELDIDANEIYGLSNMEDLKRIMLYLKQFCKLTPKSVQARGACMLARVRRCATIPYEYTNSHLRSQIVMFVCNLVEYLFPMLHVHIKGNYGHVRLTKSHKRKKD